MTHINHSIEPNTIWHDDCPECTERAEKLPASLGQLDDRNQLRAWRNMRAWAWTGGHPEFEITWQLSRPDAQLYNALYTIGVFMERAGIGPDEVEQRMASRLAELEELARTMGFMPEADR